MRLIDLLRKLALLGDKIPEAMAILGRIVNALSDGLQAAEVLPFIEDVGKLIALFATKSDMRLVSFGVTEDEEEAALIETIAANCDANATPGVYAALDGSRIKNLIEFVKNNPQLLAILLSLL